MKRRTGPFVGTLFNDMSRPKGTTESQSPTRQYRSNRMILQQPKLKSSNKGL
ncbi:hypothetical protein [Agrobacterium tumefaciens]|uniref:hypothetical protein n=1 Tax=Agrobacterium tumefaciens TaxID=358 RepID=UPI0021D14CE8|nr:hypothetical protein [Agrobacterium tumefaciens]UXS01901.1 hypothetical protein FY156_10720 [Agrobacterium tumefaciens]